MREGREILNAAEQLHSFFLFTTQYYYYQIKDDRVCEICIRHRGDEGTRSLVGGPEGKRPFERRSCRWKNIYMNVKRIGWEAVDRIRLARDKEPTTELCPGSL
jgi:hypothetical protein